jgi:hypothetical protein
MNLTAEQIEYIIREVVRRLTEMNAASPVTPGVELVLAERLVTLRDIEKRLTGIAKVSIGLRTVVTPSVRDLLRQKKIELVRRTTNSN